MKSPGAAARRFCAISCLVFLTGCFGSTDNRCEVSGMVKLKGVPVKEGLILFQPIGSPTDGGAATQAGANITSGNYQIPKESGLVPAKYKVLITAGDGVTPANPDEPPGPTGNIISKDLIPAEYNVESKQEITVSSEGSNIFNYDIP